MQSKPDKVIESERSALENVSLVTREYWKTWDKIFHEEFSSKFQQIPRAANFFHERDFSLIQAHKYLCESRGTL